METLDPQAIAAAANSPRGRTRRRSGRRSGGLENAAPPSQSVTRFGFKKRAAIARAAQETPIPETEGEDEPRWTDAAGPPVDLETEFCAAPASIEAAKALLKIKATADKYDYKAKQAELTDHNKQLKGAVLESVRRDDSLRNHVVAAQDQINGRLKALAEGLGVQTAANNKLRLELSESRRKGEDQRTSLAKQRKDCASAKADNDALRLSKQEVPDRAEGAEAQLKERDAQVASLQQEGEALSLAKQSGEEQNALLVQRASDTEAKHTQEREQASSEHAQWRSEAEAREASLTDEYKAEQARTATLETQLATTTAARDALEEKHTAMSAQHTALSGQHATLVEREAAGSAKLTVLEESLAQKDAVLAQKDADLRASIQSISQMQKDHREEVTHERDRAQKLDEEAQKLRAQERELHAALEAAKVAAASSQEKLDAWEKERTETATALQEAAIERDRLNVDLAEARTSSAKHEEGEAQLQLKFDEAQSGLESANAALAETSKKLEESTREARETALEFRSYKEHNSSSSSSQLQAIAELKVSVDRLSTDLDEKSTMVVEQKEVLDTSSAYVSALEQKLRYAEKGRRDLHNTIQERAQPRGRTPPPRHTLRATLPRPCRSARRAVPRHWQELKGSIRVFCRVRPGLAGAEQAIEIGEHDNALKLSRPGKDGADLYPFNFDKIFRPQTPQERVFEEVEGLVQSALDGYKVCIFAYGQTGTGKTFTMQGTKEPEQWGLIPRSLAKILQDAEGMRSSGWTWTMTASFMEIYNEELRDLLHTGAPASARDYTIRHDEAWGTEVTNMTKVEVGSMEQINELMNKASKKRSVGVTDMNSASSRSHSIFALYLKGTNTERNEELLGALHLVDLAGSERLDKSGAVGVTLKETQNINKSLSCLTDVFVAKSNGQAHVPFRNSKLTHLMQPCLSGQGKTLMVLNVGPEESNSHETLCALRFASHVGQCDVGGKAKRSSAKTGAAAEKAPAKSGAGGASRPAGAAASKTAGARPQTAPPRR